MKLCVVGIGRVGLPLALYFAAHDVETIGLDIDREKIEKLKAGKMPFLEEGAPEILKKTVGKTFFPTDDFSSIAKCDAVILTLGTPVDEFLNPDFSQIQASLDSMLPFVKKGQTLILRSTVSPGSTEYVRSYIEKKTGFECGRDFYLAFCPERIAEGKAMRELEELPEIVGGIDEKSAKKAMEVFRSIGKEAYETTALNAELLKLFTNMYRYINFAIANEFMVIAEEWGANIYEIVELSNRNYPRGGPRQPGFAAGPCLFKDGFFLMEKIPFPDLISTAWKVNEGLPAYLVAKAAKLKSIKGKKAAILGMSFKANSDDTRASLSYKVKKLFAKEMAEVRTHDVYIDGPDFDSAIAGADFLVIATAHNEYRKPLEHYRKLLAKNAVIIDIWNVFGRKSVVFQI
ncbi:MAG: nucleotide sugar dehydrogenase [Candidatus Micrarchaeota archaeon]|nr:nucleotide sugar dehydrogenase [Candidatus Micrarchaeota archaeon]